MKISKAMILTAGATAAFTAAWPSVGCALDYNAVWEFRKPIGLPSQATWLPPSELVYDQSTGDLTYKPLEGGWNPPDIGSLTGQLDAAATLKPVPLTFDYTAISRESPLASTVPLPPRTPRFAVDEVFGGQRMIGSNAVLVSFDPYSFWPFLSWSLILEQYGLSEFPTSYDYGRILPPGLSREFLETDLYVANFPSGNVRLVIVPEPTAVLLVAVGLAVTGRRARRG
jgi:hypothetical protein